MTQCERCNAEATVTLPDIHYDTERLCLSCTVAVTRDRAFSRAWHGDVTFEEASTIGKQAARDLCPHKRRDSLRISDDDGRIFRACLDCGDREYEQK